jgi:sugar/nucleoside kinase (ribokinase family)
MKDFAMNTTERRVDIVVAGHVCLDLIPRFRPPPAASLADVMAPGKLVNVDEAAVSTGGAVSNTGLALIRLGAKTLLMGAAAPQSSEVWANRALWEAAFLVEEVASATGAGDCTIAGFLSALLRGCGPEQCVRTASCVGAQNVKVLDAVGGVHTWEETQAMMRDWPKRRQLPGAAWQYCDAAAVWKHIGDRNVTSNGNGGGDSSPGVRAAASRCG